MTAVLLRGKYAVLLALAACQPAGAGDDARLTAIETKLDTVATKLDAITTKLDASTRSLEQLTANADAIEARAKEAEDRRVAREQDRVQRGRLDLADPFATPESTVWRELEEASEGIECEGGGTTSMVCRLDRAFVAKTIDDPTVFAKHARVVPFTRDGEVRGYKLYGIRPGSLPKLLGLKNGDAVTAADGKPLDSLEAVMDLYEALRKGSRSFSLAIDRRGAPLTLTLEILE